MGEVAGTGTQLFISKSTNATVVQNFGMTNILHQVASQHTSAEYTEDLGSSFPAG